MTCNGDCNQGRECNCKCKMTDFQNWWDGYFHEINGQKETAQAAWQARGELDAVRIKDLTALVVQQDKDNNNYAKEIIELTAKLDKAREALSFSKGIVETVRQGMRDTEWKTNLELKWWDALRPVIQEINVTLRELDK